jgi:sigma-B regulation protein RsbU (phosphoserine phosphatase)
MNTHTPPWQAELDTVVDLMRNLSRQTDPQAAAQMYGEGLARLNLFPADRYVAISRRGLAWPQFRVTRSDTWADEPNPWKEPGRLPLLSGGMLADILYSNRPAVIPNLPDVLRPDDPAFPYLQDMRLLLASPHFDTGESINMGLLMSRDPASFPMELFPRIVFQANLWGRATLNLVTQQKLQAAYDAIDRELRVVADIQRSLLPRDLPSMKNATVAAHYQTSQHAGGDYYDFFPLPDDRWGIFMADVSGHGTPAAVLMAITHAIAHMHPGHPMPPDGVLAFLNSRLAGRYTSGGTFVTAFYGVFDPEARTLAYASAGHPPPRHLRACQIMGLDGETSLPLGIDPAEPYLRHTLSLAQGDRVLLYTDGVPDTFNPAGDTFGTARLDDACRRAGNEPTADAFLRRILADADSFAAGTPPADDRTLVVLNC